MADRKIYLDLIRELAKGDPDAYRERCAQLDEAGWDELGLVVAAAFFLAARKYLGAAADKASVIRLVAEVRSDMSGTAFDLDPRIAEKLIEAAISGETGELDDVDASLIIESEMFLLWKLLRGLAGEEMANFLSETGELAERWAVED